MEVGAPIIHISAFRDISSSRVLVNGLLLKNIRYKMWSILPSDQPINDWTDSWKSSKYILLLLLRLKFSTGPTVYTYSMYRSRIGRVIIHFLRGLVKLPRLEHAVASMPPLLKTKTKQFFCQIHKNIWWTYGENFKGYLDSHLI